MIALAGEKELDKDWVELIKEALKLGISIDEIRGFLNK
ncbi:anti-repressor SinI family protein [Neobacillus pocheonensis]|uniref:Anti-repressor SinI family protein n=1 Tax=Neobacillus pocheonensis TaxID=363869 RepID=A0ABT0WEK3_9BACI|nr:anti-repressor SinI family protein [Neobacillus pocheonensis]